MIELRSTYSKRDVQVVKAWAELIDSKSWTYFCTFTTSHTLTPKGARAKMNKYLEHLQKLTSYKPGIFWVAEPFNSSGYHIHALIDVSPFDFAENDIENAWKVTCGNSQNRSLNKSSVVVYGKSKGAHFYTAKNLGRNDVDYDLI